MTSFPHTMARKKQQRRARPGARASGPDPDVDVDVEAPLLADDHHSDRGGFDDEPASVARANDPLVVEDYSADATDDTGGNARDVDDDRELIMDAPGGEDAAENERAGKVGDVQTIFALWNTMVGASVLAVPWAFTESGVVLGAVVAALMTVVMGYTASLVVRYGSRGRHEDLASMAGEKLGPWAKLLCNVAMALMMAQCVVVFDMMLSTSVYSVVKGFADLRGSAGRQTLMRALVDADSSTNSTGWATCTNSLRDAAKCWNPESAIIVTAVLLLILGSFRHLDAFVAMSVFGPFFMSYLICFIVFNSVVANAPVTPIEPIANFSTVRKTAGLLTSCMFSHHAVVPICRANRQSKNNARNVAIAYVLTFISYVTPAIAGNFSASYVALRRGENGSSEAANFLRSFPASDLYTLSAHLAVTAQFLTMVPLLLYILRTQVLGLLPNVPASLNGGLSFIINASILALGSFCAAQPSINIGMILSKCGAIFGLIFAYVVPIFTHFKGRRGTGTHPLYNHVLHISILVIGAAVAASQLIPEP